MRSMLRGRPGITTVILLAAAGLALAPLTALQTPSPAPHLWGDRLDGTYANPVLPADYSDIDAIRVGSDYFAISSTIHVSPGMAVLHSKDLVNWKTISHVVPDISALDPDLNWDRMNQYGRGVWAGAIRHHAGKFWVYFNVPSTGFFVSTAPSAAGPWTPAHNMWKVAGWNDPCPFWDDDGQGYLVTTNFSDNYKIYLFKLSADGRSINRESGRVIHQSKGSEASKLYKIDGFYYHLYSDVTSEGRVVRFRRSSSLDGPWEMRQAIHVNPKLDKEPNQGGLIQLPSGEWFFFTHQGTGDWEGRAANLLPVTWLDKWPILGQVGSDGIGAMVWHGKKPLRGSELTPTDLSDSFDRQRLGEHWEWNHQPRAGKWSLTERRGHLRLHAFAPLRPSDFWTVGNTISQRSWRTPHNEVTAEIDLRALAPGQHAGLVHFGRTFGFIGATNSRTSRTIELNGNGKIAATGPELKQDRLWLRSVWDIDGNSQFSYSLDGKAFTPLGPTYQLTWGRYRGDRIGVFTYNDSGESGHVDIADFRYRITR